MATDWKRAVADEIASLNLNDRDREAFLRENIESVGQVIAGLGPDDSKPRDGAGARIVFNMSCKHRARLLQGQRERAERLQERVQIKSQSQPETNRRRQNR